MTSYRMVRSLIYGDPDRVGALWTKLNLLDDKLVRELLDEFISLRTTTVSYSYDIPNSEEVEWRDEDYGVIDFKFEVDRVCIRLDTWNKILKEAVGEWGLAYELIAFDEDYKLYEDSDGTPLEYFLQPTVGVICNFD